MKAIIEMLKNDSRRRHVKYDKTGFVDLGPIKDIIPVNNGIMPVDYGYFPETLNEAEGDEIDVLVLSEKVFEVGSEIEVEAIALIKREDGDDKIVAVDTTKKYIKEWSDVEDKEKQLIIEFFGYNSKIKTIEDSKMASKYLQKANVDFLKPDRYK